MSDRSFSAASTMARGAVVEFNWSLYLEDGGRNPASSTWRSAMPSAKSHEAAREVPRCRPRSPAKSHDDDDDVSLYPVMPSVTKSQTRIRDAKDTHEEAALGETPRWLARAASSAGEASSRRGSQLTTTLVPTSVSALPRKYQTASSPREVGTHDGSLADGGVSLAPGRSWRTPWSKSRRARGPPETSRGRGMEASFNDSGTEQRQRKYFRSGRRPPRGRSQEEFGQANGVHRDETAPDDAPSQGDSHGSLFWGWGCTGKWRRGSVVAPTNAI